MMTALVVLCIALGVALILTAVAWARSSSRSKSERQTAVARASRSEVEALSERERIEAIRREAEVREEILASMTEGVVLTDTAGTITYANPAARGLIGPVRALPPSIAEPGSHDFLVYHPHRRELRATTVGLDDGRRLLALRDVTEAKRVDAMRRDFVADASHELKTPVAAILATAESLDHAIDEDPVSARRFATRLLAEARRLGELVGDLLDLARFEKGNKSAEPLALSDLVVRELDRMRDEVESKGLTLTREIEPGVRVPAGADDLALAVRNLLDNAVRYTDHGEITVRLQRADGNARFEVADTGVGIPSKDLPRIFERFYRVDKARSRDTGGTGLGLSIVRHAVEGAGGTVTAESDLTSGSRFTVILPLAHQ